MVGTGLIERLAFLEHVCNLGNGVLAGQGRALPRLQIGGKARRKHVNRCFQVEHNAVFAHVFAIVGLEHNAAARTDDSRARAAKVQRNGAHGLALRVAEGRPAVGFHKLGNGAAQDLAQIVVRIAKKAMHAAGQQRAHRGLATGARPYEIDYGHDVLLCCAFIAQEKCPCKQTLFSQVRTCYHIQKEYPMQKEIYAARRERLRRLMRARGLDTLLVSLAANRYYLSGFELHDPQFNESAGHLVITASGQDWLATDPRYTEAAARLWERERVFVYRGDGAKDMAGLLRTCGGRIGIDPDGVRLGCYRSLVGAAPGLVLEEATGLLERLRRIKDSAEIAAMEQSFALNHKMLAWVEGELTPGKSEAQLAWEIERYFREHGASELAFASIVAVGANAALPHAIPGETPIRENDCVLIDVGCRVQGYCSDQTRTFWVGAQEGPAFQRFRETRDTVREVQDACIRAMHPGMPLKDVHMLAVNLFEQKGVAAHFTHGLGHGVGLETHEAPSLSPRGTGVLEEGMVVTVEPGLYYPEWGGVRWEYTIMVENGAVRAL